MAGKHIFSSFPLDPAAVFFLLAHSSPIYFLPDYIGDNIVLLNHGPGTGFLIWITSEQSRIPETFKPLLLLSYPPDSKKIRSSHHS